MHALTLLLTGLIAGMPAADTTNLRAIVNKAIEAHGGAANLKRYQAVKFTENGKLHSGGQVKSMHGEFAYQWPDRAWFSIEFESRGRKHHMLAILNGTRAWMIVNGKNDRISERLLTERRELTHAQWIVSLRALLDSSMTIASAGETRVDGRLAAGVIVTDKEHRPVKLFFDKDSGLLVKSENVTNDLESHQETTDETFYTDYRTIQGLKIAMRTKVLRDGKLFFETVRAHVTFSEKLDDRLFAEP